jgi:two-component system nitrogen regulation sensor histidine kinase NtrY
MKNVKILLGLLVISILAIVTTGVILNFIGIEHGPLIIKIGFIFLVVNIVLYLLFLIFLVIRNLITLYREKQQKIAGSKFRTKLVVAFLGLTLIPTTLLFILSNQLINNSIDKWFSLEVQKPIDDSMSIARNFYIRGLEDVRDYADFLSSNHKSINIYREANNREGNYKIFLFQKPGESALVQNAFKGIADTEIMSTEKGDILRAASPVTEGGKISGVVVVESIFPKDIVEKLELIQKAYNEYRQIESQQNPIKFLYFIILAIATLVIIFLALWAALRIAKGITVPIRSLAEATNEIAHGNLNYRIDLHREDEIGLLINSFNKMVGELKEGKFSLEKAYVESDRRRLSMEAILENIATGVIFLDRSGRIATLNSAACSMLNLKRDEIIGKSHKELLGKIKSEDLDAMIKKLEEKDFKFTEGEVQAYVDGRPVNIRVYITVLKDSKNNFIGVLVVFDDLTEIITAQRALAWQEVAKRIAHEIKNPLTPIKLSSERVLKKWNEKAVDFEEVLKRSMKTVVKEVDSLRNLVDEFSRLGKMPEIERKSMDINAIVEEVLELYKDVREVKFFTSLQDTPKLAADREQIKRALINLIDNAIQAKTEKIWLHTSFDPFLEIIRVEIADEGFGIRDDEKEKLFVPYFSTKKDGTGLGLAIVNAIISKHRGYIRVKNNEPKGTRFIVELPIR